MSGICGVWSFNGGEPELEPVLALLERRGPDGTRSWAEGPVALGHTLLATTPEALVEALPLTDKDSGCTITADARIDNREELIAALVLGGETRTIGDGELILRAYLKWGEECPAHLLGDFAFAIWDARAERLFCARDHMGMRQLIYYHAPGKLFAFATEVAAVLVHPGVPKRLNEGRVADYLADLEGIDLTSTFFENVIRLPPAHTLTINSSGLVLRRYWQLIPGPVLKLESDEAYAKAFLKIFTEAVRCRLRSPGPVGSMLSGGIDSNAVSAVAAQLLSRNGNRQLRTFSAVGPDTDSCAETRAIHAGLTAPGYDPTCVCYAELDDYFDDLVSLTLGSAEPFDADMTLLRVVYLAGQRADVKVMLDGVGGDMVMTSDNRVAALLRQGRVISAVRQLRDQSALFGGSGLDLVRPLLAATWAAFAPSGLRHLGRRVLGWYRDSLGEAPDGLIAEGFGHRIDLERRRAQYRSQVGRARPIGAQQRARVISHPHLVVGRERYDRVASELGIEPRDPFLDLRLIEFCLTVPDSQLKLHGWPKSLLRRATVGIVPDAIVRRRTKEHLGWTFTESVFFGLTAPRAFNTPYRSKIKRFVRPVFHNAKQKYSCEMDRLREFKLIILDAWLVRNEEAVQAVRVGGCKNVRIQ